LEDDGDDGDDDDMGSERSYNDSDCEYYYELKEMREKRKLEIFKEKLQERRRKEKALEGERYKDTGGIAACKALEKDQKKCSRIGSERREIPSVSGSQAR
jgi:hypothetical protein